jgi:emp24/gp25L/p24 family/GOLD
MCREVATESGEYIFCLDNSFSHLSKKTVFFELYVRDDDSGITNSLDGLTDSVELLQFEVSLENFKV